MDVEEEDVEDEEDLNVAEDGVEEEDPSQDREAHFAQAFAVEMHMDISQERFCVEIQRNRPDTDEDTSM